jgi:hypothetical protein
MDWSPLYRLYASDGSTLIYTFDFIVNDNGPQDPIKFTEISGIRGGGSIIIGGSKQSWDLTLDFWLIGNNYQALIAKINTLQSTILMNVPYVLKIDLTPSTTLNYNVKRIVPIRLDPSQRFYSQKGSITFKALSW